MWRAETLLILQRNLFYRGNQNECAICLESMSGRKTVTLNCNKSVKHKFHESCIVEWLRHSNTCPLCRRTIGKQKNFSKKLNQALDELILRKRNPWLGRLRPRWQPRGHQQGAISLLVVPDEKTNARRHTRLSERIVQILFARQYPWERLSEQNTHECHIDAIVPGVHANREQLRNRGRSICEDESRRSNPGGQRTGSEARHLHFFLHWVQSRNQISTIHRRKIE